MPNKKLTHTHIHPHGYFCEWNERNKLMPQQQQLTWLSIWNIQCKRKEKQKLLLKNHGTSKWTLVFITVSKYIFLLFLPQNPFETVVFLLLNWKQVWGNIAKYYVANKEKKVKTHVLQANVFLFIYVFSSFCFVY